MSAYQRIEYRCESKVHGVRKEFPNGQVLLEIRCKEKWCANRQAGEVVFHYFDIETGILSHTKKFKDPAVNRIRQSGGSSQQKINNQN